VNGTDPTRVKNVMTYTNLYPWCLVNVVPICGTCQWTAAGTFRYGAKGENPEFLYTFNWRVSSAGTGTDRL